MPRIVQVTATQVTLNWTPGYLTEPTRWRVYRNGQLAVTSVGSSYTDRNLTAGAWYSYHLVSVDGAGNTSPPTRTLTVQTRGPGVQPQGPRNLVATDVDPGRVTLQFTVPDDDFDVSLYEIYDGPAVVLRTYASSWTGLPATAVVRHLEPGSAHAYSVVARRLAGPSAPSNTITPTTPGSADATAPTVPSGLTVTEDRYGCTFVDVRWLASSDDTDPAAELDYEIFVDGVLSETIRGQVAVGASYVGSGTRTVSVRAIDSSGNLSASASRAHTVDPFCSE